MIESAVPQGLLEDERVHAAWALFFSKFIEAYKDLVRAKEGRKRRTCYRHYVMLLIIFL